MGGGKRFYSRISELCSRAVAASDDHIHHSEKSSSMATTIDDIPDLVLVEILRQLPCFKFLFQCKCVSKRWCTLIQDPYFIGRFLCRLQSDHQQTPIVSTVINTKGEEFLSRLSSSSSKPLAPLFKRLMRFHDLNQQPYVVATYKDLVLCCRGDYYYICNPYTIQWVPLPPPPRIVPSVAMGFICDDYPYYNHKKEDDRKGNIIQLNAEYRYKVVKIIWTARPDSNFEVQIFSSETGKWKESIVSYPLNYRMYASSNIRSFAFNGMLYWMIDRRILIRLDTFGYDIGDRRAWSSIDFGRVESHLDRCVGVCRGRLLIGEYDFIGNTLNIVELSEELIKLGGEAGNLCLKHIAGMVYTVCAPCGVGIELMSFDPTEEDILYLRICDQRYCKSTTKYIVKYDIRTDDLSPIIEDTYYSGVDHFACFSLELPWWPTPLPGRPQRRQLAPRTRHRLRCLPLDLSTSKAQPAARACSSISMANNAKAKVDAKVENIGFPKGVTWKRRRA